MFLYQVSYIQAYKYKKMSGYGEVFFYINASLINNVKIQLFCGGEINFRSFARSNLHYSLNMIVKIMRKQILSLVVALLVGSTVCMAQTPKQGKGKMDREKRMEQMITDLGLNEKQAKDFKAAMEEMRPAKRSSATERPSREEMQKKRKEMETKIKSILTDDQYKKYQEIRQKENANRRKRTK